MDILDAQQDSIKQLRISLRDAAARVDLPSVAYYRMLIQKKLIMVKCLEKGREEAAK